MKGYKKRLNEGILLKISAGLPLMRPQINQVILLICIIYKVSNIYQFMNFFEIGLNDRYKGKSKSI